MHQFAIGPTAGELRMAYRSDNDAAAKFLMPGEETAGEPQRCLVDEDRGTASRVLLQST